ncbi:helix-turn-helix domain-containing protein [Streptomyces sp. RS10V-4]|uniref:helix-turn-helix domain-containing protein n=1 Tax=Streptomyces rhizoryzae TaxID=2932493 RepID=UPI0020063EF6|nr:helix-turn-helix transcriptional regulator [Streptomyces rhizoryzae]MCK7624608.1 helix-turn-helix domain-containing protein [Streptomyces rhizoryzae]
MADGPTGSTVPRRQLGRHLRELRGKSRLTVRAAARALEWSEAKMWRIETGQVSLRSHDVQTMCTVYGAPADLTEALMGLAKETKARGWWHAYGDVIPEGFQLYVGLEDAAASTSLYQSELIPGHLQTEGYAEAVIRGHLRGISQENLDGRVRLRMERQASLTRPVDPLELRVALNETVLRRPIGGSDVMMRQLAHLIYMSERPNVAIRVVPFARGMHLGVASGGFNLLRFPLNADGSETEPATVYVEGFTGSLYLDKPKEVEEYDAAFRDIWEKALDDSASRRLIAEVAGEYEQR